MFAPTADAVAVLLNGEETTIERSTIASLLVSQGLVGKRVAVERNGSIVPKSLHDATWIEQGDRLEIVVAVGGG